MTMSKTPSVLASEIESLLFAHGEPLTEKELAQILAVSKSDMAPALSLLRARYQEPESGLLLLEKNGEVKLATKPGNASIIEEYLQKDREATLGRASLETLSVIAYRAPVSRADIDAIRGVNSSSAIRALLLRGLIERQENPLDKREYVFSPSFRLLETLGVARVDALPDYEALSREKNLPPSSLKDDGLSEASKEI